MSEPSLLRTADRRRYALAALPGLLAIAIAIAPACASPRHRAEADDLVSTPELYLDVESPTVSLEEGCGDFSSPILAAHLERLEEDNFNLQAARARVEQADALARTAGATRWPTMEAQASASRSRAPAPPAGTVESNRFSLSALAGYEIDLWGQLAALRQAASLDADAARLDAQSLALTLTAELAESWFDLVHQKERLRLLDEQLTTSIQFLELTELRMSRGAATALDVHQQEQQIEFLRGQVAIARAARDTAMQRLAVLLGRPPQEGPALVEEADDALPALSALPEVGLPAELVERRPDLRAALLRIESADERTYAAAVDRLPTLRLSASTFLQTDVLADLIDDIFWTLGSTLAQPLFDGGRRNAEVDRAEAAARERLYAYGQVLLQALFEVQSAMVLETGQRDFIEHLEAQHARAELSLQLAGERYAQGALDYLRVLTALQSLYQIEESLLDARRRQLSHRVQLCRALGGGIETAAP